MNIPEKGIVAEGKTKIIRRMAVDPFVGCVTNKDVVTWFNDKKLPMPGKGVWATAVTCDIFEFLAKKKQLPLAYIGRSNDPQCYFTELCDMLLFEVVATGIVAPNSSFSKRHPEFAAETILAETAVHFFLKTSGKKYRNVPLPCDDPLMAFGKGDIALYLPSKPISEQDPILSVPWSEMSEFFPGIEYVAAMQGLTVEVYQLLQQSYARLSGRLYDIKVEYGRALRPKMAGKLLIADVIDADSMRLTFGDRRADKQPIRNGGEAAYDAQVAAYRLAAEMSGQLK